MTDAELPDNGADGCSDTTEGMDRVYPTGIDPVVEGALSDPTADGKKLLFDRGRIR